MGLQFLLGGKNKDKFVPNVNFSFDCESNKEKYFVNFNRSSVIVNNEKAEILNNETRLTVGKEADCFKTDGNKLKWDIDFIEKPKTNIFEWKISCSPGITFHYQPKLPAYDDAGDLYQAEDVIGSYAVYCNKTGHIKNKRNETIINYQAGKLFHIYRPLCIDFNGQKVWADLKIEKDILSIVIPKDYIESCAYPMRLDPTFGYSTIGANSGFSNANFMHSSHFSVGGSGNGSKMYVYCALTGNIKTAIQGYSGNTSVGAAITNGVTSGRYIDSAVAWHEFTFSSPPQISNTTYFLSFCTDVEFTRLFDSVAGAGGYSSQSYSTYPPNSATISPATDRRYSIYCEYVAPSFPFVFKNQMAHMMIR